MSKNKVLLAAGFLILLALFFILDLQRYFNLDYFQSQRQALLAFRDENFLAASAGYFLLYVVTAALSLPVATLLTLAGGAIFGFWWGLLLVSFASSIGATLGFLVVRGVLHDWVQKKFGKRLKRINQGMERDGRYFLFSVRVVPIFPFFLVNALMALTPIRVRDFYLMSQLGMLFGTIVYVNVGAQLGQATSLPDVLGFDVLFAMVLLAAFPWLARALLDLVKRRKEAAAYKRPKRADANVVVIGAGSAGLVTAYIAALVKARVILIENGDMGGDCLNTGCVPSKTLISSARVSHQFKRARDFGLTNASADVDFPAVMQRVRNVITAIEPNDSVERYTRLGVDCILGKARITSPYTVMVNGHEITTRNIVIATGARPLIPSLPGLADVHWVTSETIWDLKALPGRFLVLGAGPIGAELAQAFSRLGSSVTMVDRSPRLLPKEDEDVSAAVLTRFKAEAITFLGGHEIIGFEPSTEGGGVMLATEDGHERRVAFDVVLLALGRKANTEGFGLEELGVPLTDDGTISVNHYLQTRFPNIFACGDVTGPYQFTHMASFQAWYASVNSLFSGLRQFRVDYSLVPWATFIDPEVAKAGLNEQEAREEDIDFEVTRYDLEDLDRAIAEGEDYGFIKVLTPPGKDRILGVTIVGHNAAELIAEFILAMKHGIGLKKLMGTIHIYPTFAESNKFAASEWRKNNAPEWIYPWLERFHRWRRGG